MQWESLKPELPFVGSLRNKLLSYLCLLTLGLWATLVIEKSDHKSDWFKNRLLTKPGDTDRDRGLVIRYVEGLMPVGAVKG